MILGYDFVEERLYSDLLEEEKLFAWAQLAKKAGLNEAEKRAVGAMRKGAANNLFKTRPGKVYLGNGLTGADAIQIEGLQGHNNIVALDMAKEMGKAKVPKDIAKGLKELYPRNPSEKEKLAKRLIEETMGKPLDKITRKDFVLFRDNIASGLKKIGSMQ